MAESSPRRECAGWPRERHRAGPGELAGPSAWDGPRDRTPDGRAIKDGGIAAEAGSHSPVYASPPSVAGRAYRRGALGNTGTRRYRAAILESERRDTLT